VKSRDGHIVRRIDESDTAFTRAEFTVHSDRDMRRCKRSGRAFARRETDPIPEAVIESA